MRSGPGFDIILMENTLITKFSDRGFVSLRGSQFASAGVKALPGMAIDRAVLPAGLSMGEGFAAAERYLQELRLPVSALCGFELRMPKQLTFDQFSAFNDDIYLAQLSTWNVLIEGGRSPLTRTNVAPTSSDLKEASVHAFSYLRPAGAREASGIGFVLSGAPELADDQHYPDGIILRGETSETALIEKVHATVRVLAKRIEALTIHWDRAARVHLYSQRQLAAALQADIVARLGGGPSDGIVWHDVAPPVPELELEIDFRFYSREIYI
jgi:hypothetical protein